MKTFTTLIAIALGLAGSIATRPAAAAPPPHCPVVTMVTDEGTILIKLFPEYAPITCANFVKLINKRFYDGLTFHRVANLGSGLPAIVAQGGDPKGDGSGGPGYTIKGEFTTNGVGNPLRHSAGAVAMARSSDEDSGGSQFYICITQAFNLDERYAVFGMVIKGMDVAKKLKVGDKMRHVTVKE